MIKKLINKYKKSSVIFKASVWFVLVTIIDNAISILTHPFVNRILSVEQVGINNVYSTWKTVLRIVATFNLFCGVYEVFLVDYKDDQNQVRGSLCLLSSIITILFFIPLFIAVVPLSSLLGLKPIYFVVMFISVLSEEIIQFYTVKLRFKYQYIRYSILVISLFFIKSILPSSIASVVLFTLIMKEASFKGITKYWKQSIKFNLPLIPHYLSSILLSSSDKVMLQKLTNEYYVGIYSVVYSFSSLSLIVFTALNNSYTPWAYNALKEKNYNELKKKTNTIVFISILFCSLLMLFAPEGVFILGGKEYLQALPIVPVLICGTFFSSFYFIFSNVEFINKKTKAAFPITLCGSILNIGLNWWLVPMLGYEAAAYTTLIGYVFIAICHYVYSRYITKEAVYDIKTICFMLFLLFTITIGSIFIYKTVFWVRYLIIVLFGLLFIFVVLKYLKKQKRAVSDNEKDNI